MDGKVDAGLLIFINIILELSLAQLIEGDDDEGNKDVDEKEREDNKEHNVEDALLCPKPRNWSLILICGGHGVLEDGDPALAGLDSEECEHGDEAVVVVEVPPLPPPDLLHWGTLAVHVDKVRPSERDIKTLRQFSVTFTYWQSSALFLLSSLQ